MLSRNHIAAGIACILLLTVAAYLPVITHSTWIWDDDNYITTNLTLRDAHGLYDIWTNGRTEFNHQYYPLVQSFFWLEYHIWGLHPMGYHINNILLHVANALLLWRVLRELKVPGAWLAAAIFAVHPVHVESVAWATERKNVLSGLLYLLALISYLKFDPPERSEMPRRWGFYALSLVLFLCALLSKTVTSSLPVVIALLFWWKRPKLSWQALVPLVPMLIAGAALGSHTAYMERTVVGATGPEWAFSSVDRCLIAGRALWFYAGKLFWPHPLIFNYERWDINAHDPLQYLYPISALAVLVILVILIKKTGKGPLTAILFFAVTLMPALGFFNIYPMRYSFVADHFQYLASIGIIALVTGLLSIAARRIPHSMSIRACAIAGLLGLLGIVTWTQGFAYEDAFTLWYDTIENNNQSYLAYGDLGLEYIGIHEFDKAIPLLQRAIQIKPTWLIGYGAMAKCYLRMGAMPDAQQIIQQAFKVPVDDDLGWCYVYTALGEVDQHLNRPDKEILAAYARAIELAPRQPEPHARLGEFYMLRDNTPEAIRELTLATEIQPGYAHGHFLLARIHMAQDHLSQAEAELSLCSELGPHQQEYLCGMAMLLAHRNDLQGALKLASEACEYTHYQAAYPLEVLSKLHAHAGDFDQAVKYGKNARAAAIAAHEVGLLTDIDASLAAFNAHRMVDLETRTEEEAGYSPQAQPASNTAPANPATMP